MKIHLSPARYQRLQEFVHDYERTTRSLTELMRAHAGDTVIEVGSGTGALARSFLSGGFDYVGVEIDPARVALAEKATPEARFVVSDALALSTLDLPPTRRFFIHGLLHHLDDEQCRDVLRGLLSLREGIVLAVVEPFRPPAWWRAPLGTLFARLDEGKHVRPLEAWRSLFGANLDTLRTVSLRPRWPVPLLHARLTLRTS